MIESHSPRPSARRPWTVTAIAFLFIAAGLLGVTHHATDMFSGGTFRLDEVWLVLIRSLAIVAGVFMLRRADWARWLALAWLAYHVALSAFHSFSDTLIHGLLLAGIAFVLLHSASAAWFRGEAAEVPRQ
jgi:hypothetical protein